jgi:hypothetical protein
MGLRTPVYLIRLQRLAIGGGRIHRPDWLLLHIQSCPRCRFRYRCHCCSRLSFIRLVTGGFIAD